MGAARLRELLPYDPTEPLEPGGQYLLVHRDSSHPAPLTEHLEEHQIGTWSSADGEAQPALVAVLRVGD